VTFALVRLSLKTYSACHFSHSYVLVQLPCWMPAVAVPPRSIRGTDQITSNVSS